MHRGFQLSVRMPEDFINFWQEKGQSQFDKSAPEVRKKLSDLLLDNGKVDATGMQENWFPLVEADVFISHSHRNQRQAIALAGWLHGKFGLTSFIDSCIWGYSNDLLRQIDDVYCPHPNGKMYSYEKRNQSTSHVHMMLSSALAMMIDNTECLFFLNTPDSLSVEDSTTSTDSPWIYSELTLSRLIRRKSIQEHRNAPKLFSKAAIDELNESFQYNVDLRHLSKLDTGDLVKWQDSQTLKGYALDDLYEQHPLPIIQP